MTEQISSSMPLWLDRIAAMQAAHNRQFANLHGLQAVHLDMMHYIRCANLYSNTAQAMADYLGLTKGSVSQSLKILVEQDWVNRIADVKDRRITRLSLTQRADDLLAERDKALWPAGEGDQERIAQLEDMLRVWQRGLGQAGFGLCRTCRHHETRPDGVFYCRLTEEILEALWGNKLCRDHHFPAR